MRTAGLSLALAALLLGAPPARAEPLCPAENVPPLYLPKVKAAIAENREITIVALGSSSTQGWHASDIAHSYPAVLQNTLNAALPAAHVAVLNRGVGGQDIQEMLPRLDRDVLGIGPTLVIWQVGANGAMRNLSVDLFKQLLTQGVHHLRDAQVDVVLMDNQRAPAILASPSHLKIDQALADVAVTTGAGLFSRGRLMAQWQNAGHRNDEFVSDDGVHHNDHGYRCVAEALTHAIVEGLAPTPEPQAIATKR